MYRNKVKKYIAVVLSMAAVLTTSCIPEGMTARAADADRLAAQSTEEKTIFEEGTGDYGYKSLSDNQKALYDELSRKLEAFEAGEGNYTQFVSKAGVKCSAPFEIDYTGFGLKDDESASQVWTAFLADRPWLFWLENECHDTGRELFPVVRKTYCGDAAEMKQKREDMKTQIKKSAGDCIRQIHICKQIPQAFPIFKVLSCLKTYVMYHFPLFLPLLGIYKGKLFYGLLIAANYLIKKFSRITFCLPVSMGIYIHGNTDVRMS